MCRLSNVLSILSLLLCVATCVLWVRSYWASDYVGYTHLARGVPLTRIAGGSVETGVGHAVASFNRVTIELRSGEDPSGWKLLHAEPDDPAAGLDRAKFGFGYGSNDLSFSTTGYSSRSRSIGFPLWLPPLLFALLPAARGVWATRRRTHRRLGMCPTCGYDLRATPGRCPECGAAPEPVTKS